MQSFTLWIFALCIFFEDGSILLAQEINLPKGAPISRTLRSLTIYATGNTNGYLEPCPCSKELLGGAAVRAGVFQPIRRFQRSVHTDSLGRYYLIIDAGNRLSAHRKSMNEALALSALFGRLNYDALNLGWQDLRFGVNFFKKKQKLPLLASNILDANGKTFVPKYRVLQRGEKRIAILGVVAKESFMLLDSLERQQYRWIPEDSALTAVFQELKSNPFDAAILLSNSYDPATESALLHTFSQINGIVTTSEALLNEDGEVLRIGKTEHDKFIASTGHDGEFISAVTLSTHQNERGTDSCALKVDAIFPILLKPYLTKDKEIFSRVKAIQKKFGTP